MRYVDQLDAVGRAAMEIGVEAGMQKVSDMFLAALAQEGFGEERLYRLACRVSELDTEFDGAYGCGPEADWLQERLDAILREAVKMMCCLVIDKLPEFKGLFAAHCAKYGDCDEMKPYETGRRLQGGNDTGD